MKYRCIPGLIALFLLLALAACGGTSNAPNDVNVTLTDFHIQSSVTTFTSGTSYHFVVTNKGKVAHEFMIMPMAMGNMSMDEMHKTALTFIDTVAPGETKTLDYTFAQASVGKSLEFSCHFPGHYEAGMHQTITVNS